MISNFINAGPKTDKVSYFVKGEMGGKPSYASEQECCYKLMTRNF